MRYSLILRSRFKGYTLIEVLVALTVFAILATITSSAMYNAYSTQKNVANHSEALIQVELSTTILERDIKQVVFRPVIQEQLRMKPAFWGDRYYFEFTRDGIVNPNGIDKKSTLKRIAYLCSNGQLIRRSWPQLDTPKPKNYTEQVLLQNLERCEFSFFDKRRQNLSEWTIEQPSNSKSFQMLPIAVQVNLKFEFFGEYNRIYVIPEGLYG